MCFQIVLIFIKFKIRHKIDVIRRGFETFKAFQRASAIRLYNSCRKKNNLLMRHFMVVLCIVLISGRPL